MSGVASFIAGSSDVRRFLVSPELLASPSFAIEGELYRHMIKVLRLNVGDRVRLFDGSGHEGTAVILRIGPRELTVTLESPPTAHLAQTPAITLIQGLPKGEKGDLIVQKATELGVSTIVVFPAQRSVVKIAADQRAQRQARWQKIADEAARQSRRSSVPAVVLADSLPSVLERSVDALKLLLWEGEEQRRLKETLTAPLAPASIAILVGPEGGIAESEAELAVNHGFTAVSLGPRILRTETAGLAMITILQYHWGDMG